MANDVYANRDGGEVPESPNFERMSSDQLIKLGIVPSTMIDNDSSFYSALYQDHITGNYVFALRGTQEGKDWGSDFTQAVGLPEVQYTLAAQLGTLLGQKLQGNISGVGHSLGGGLNTVADISGKFPGVNFNAAGIAPATAARLGIDLKNADDLVTSYSVPWEFLSQVANKLPLVPNTDGQRVMLPSPGSAPLLFNRHSMANVIHSIQRALAENGCK